MASGSTTPSPPAARLATTTRRWASPPAAPGRSVKRHFREMDVDIGRRRRSPLSASATCRVMCSATACCGETTIKLVAAFDHRDIFIDPAPDPASSFDERRRLFDLPRSSWQDYDKALDLPRAAACSRARSRGSRSRRRRARRSASSAQGDAAGGDEGDPESAGGSDCSSAASAPMCGPRAETDEAVGDRANDPIRITGADIRCQGDRGGRQSRHDAARPRRGGAARQCRLNTDAIDNSAGVNTSDVEVNIKIALATPMRDGRPRREARNALLAAHDRRRGGAGPAQQLSAAAGDLAGRAARASRISASEQRLMQTLETARRARSRGRVPARRQGRSPSARRARRRSRAPSWRCCWPMPSSRSSDDLLQSNVPDDPYLGRELGRYFPGAVRRAIPGCGRAPSAAARRSSPRSLPIPMINRGGPLAAGAHRRSDRRLGAKRRRRVCRRARQLRDDRAQWRDRRARQQDLRASCSSRSTQAVQDLLLDRLVWFLRNVDLTQGLGVHRRALSRRHCRGGSRRSTTCCRDKRPLRARREREAGLRREACRPSSRAVSPRCRC